MALPDIMGRLVPAAAAGRAGFQPGGRAAPVAGQQAGQSAVWANINHPCCQARTLQQGQERRSGTETLAGKELFGFVFS